MGAEKRWRRMSATDAVFLHAETQRAPLHVMGALVLEPGRPESQSPFARVRAQVERRLPALPVLRKRLAEVPWGLDLPIWVDDSRFALDGHLQRLSLPAPGGEPELRELVGRLAEVPLRRDRPLWELTVIEGLREGRFALIGKLHHAAIDGLGGAQLLCGLLDPRPDANTRDGECAEELQAEPGPCALELVGRAALSQAGRPFRAGRSLARNLRTGAQVLGAAWSGKASLLKAPHTRINTSISSRRRIATAEVSLEDVKVVKRAFAATVNHVVLAVCAGALRRYLGELGERLDQPLVAAVPMAIGGRRSDGVGNCFSAFFVRLPVHLPDPLDRLSLVREECLQARRWHEVAGGRVFDDWADLLSPALLGLASRAYSQLRLADRHRPPCNVVISNVPGPATPLYCAGSRVTSCHPFGPIYDGCGLNITVLSYNGSIAVGVLACPDTVPDADRIPLAFESCLAELKALAGSRAEPIGSLSSRSSRSSSSGGCRVS